MINIFSNILYHIIDFLFPSYCVACGSPVSYKDIFLCDKCLQKIELLSDKCEICSGELVEGICRICSNRKFYIDKNITIAAYEGIIKEVLKSYKFNKKRRLYKLLSKLALGEIIFYKDSIDIITSVPISRKKRWDRGFNQSELIAKDIACKLNKEYHSYLKEKSKFKTQKKLGYRDRFLNILGRYKISDEKGREIRGKNILIIDDVFTTGATINECARVLRTLGVNKVYSLTIARVNIKRVDNFTFSV